MKKWLLSLTMGAMVVTLGQAATAEASFSSNASKSDCKINMVGSANSLQVQEALKMELNKHYGFENILAEYNALNPSVQKEVAQKPATQKPAAQKPVENPVTQKPVAQKPVENPVAEKPAAQKPVEKPVAEKPVTQKPTTPAAPAKPATPTTPAKPTAPAPTSPSASISSIEQQVLTLTNQERSKEGLKPLAADTALMASARAKSADMSNNNYFSHNSPTLGSPFDQMKARGITYRAAAENIAMGQRTAAEVVQGWMESPGHRANIMNGNYTHIGIGYVANGNYWTQQFIQK
ncbi:CAP domain-containing protein [Paenisporosarcina indica]|uniref:CAP domain-containing protein n=1 Tax=Paenisporosarcina indica TaxID=650093 RepID=UPI00094F69A4|nr:CAP domain-containing protein [Paenisporosarcina indica]